MKRLFDPNLRRLHRVLGLAQHPKQWYRDRLQEELLERRTARTWAQKLSETADVFYILSRARYDGHPLRKPPPFTFFRHFVPYLYIYSKYTMRWGFYRVAAIMSRAPNPRSVREVVNPSKDHNLVQVAQRHGIDPIVFRNKCRMLRSVWPLFP